jgi:hypothetical protein
VSARVLEDVARTSAGVAVLERHFTVRMLNISASGALLETDTPVEPGVYGKVTLTADGRRYSDHLRVTRCQAVAGGSRHLVAAEFLWLDVPSTASLRHFAAQGPSKISKSLLSLASVSPEPGTDVRDRDRADAEVARSDYW